ncbi:MAG TPA: hypothetical protein VFZ91_11285 [Allosphingosinicella sp.]
MNLGADTTDGDVPLEQMKAERRETLKAACAEGDVRKTADGA